MREKLILMLDMRVDGMTNGLPTFEDYRHSLGYIEALRNVLSAIDEVQSDMRKE